MAPVNAYRRNAIREVLRKRVEASSLRAIAEEIGMSHSGLRTLIAGTNPHDDTWKKIERYIVATGTASMRRQVETVPRAEVEAALELLERYIAAEGRENVHARRVREVALRLFGRTVEPEGES